MLAFQQPFALSCSATELTFCHANKDTLTGCFFPLAAASLVSVCVFVLWNEAVRKKATDRRTMKRKMAISVRLLNWTVPRFCFRLVLSWEVKHRLRSTHTHTHTHTHTQNGQALLFVYHSTAGTQTNPSDCTFRLTCHGIVMPIECLLAPASRFLIACLLSLYYMPIVHAFACLQRNEQ